MLDPTTLEVQETAAPPLAVIPIALNLLILSTLNVRRTERDADVAALAEDIAARGLKQNLVVTPAHFSTGEQIDESRADWAYQYEVIAGGRRFQAMQVLVADGRLPEDHPVPCLLETRGEARETSLSENLHRVAMNPADEFDAFAAIVAQQEHLGSDRTAAIATCAKRFGVTVRHVEGRLRLAALAPEILQALRDNKLGIESAKAYAGVTDHKLQLKVFTDREKKSWMSHDPRGVRDELRGKTLALTDARVIYVGQQAYLDAGGRIETEMFMGADGLERISDVALLEKLAKEKAEAGIPAQAKIDGFKAGVFAKGVGYSATVPAAPKGFERAWDYGTETSKAEKKKSIAVYAVAADGNGLHLVTRFRPSQSAKADSYRTESPEERAAAAREREIELEAARLAVGKFAGSPFEGRAFWPNGHWINAVNEVSDDEVLVAVLVKVTRAEIEAHRLAATEKVDADRAAAESAADAGDELDEVLNDIVADKTQDEVA